MCWRFVCRQGWPFPRAMRSRQQTQAAGFYVHERLWCAEIRAGHTARRRSAGVNRVDVDREPEFIEGRGFCGYFEKAACVL
jgi:hypothetical protein